MKLSFSGNLIEIIDELQEQGYYPKMMILNPIAYKNLQIEKISGNWIKDSTIEVFKGIRIFVDPMILKNKIRFKRDWKDPGQDFWVDVDEVYEIKPSNKTGFRLIEFEE